MLTQFVSFALVGLLATSLQYALTAVLVLTGLLSLAPASTLGFLVSATFNYWANATRTFAAHAKPANNRVQQFRFAMMVAVGCACNAGLIILASRAGVSAVPSQLLATFGVLCANFALSRLWVFRRT